MATNVLITGGIGAGKSTCVKVFELLGVPVFHDDIVARNISNTNSDVIFKIKELFGEAIYDGNLLNRQQVASQVFSNSELLDKLSRIIHPAVQEAYSAWILEHTDFSYTLRESALATNENLLFDFVISVSAPFELRVKRIASRDGISRQEIVDRINSQISQEERNSNANFIVLCNDEMLVIPQIISIHNKLINI